MLRTFRSSVAHQALTALNEPSADGLRQGIVHVIDLPAISMASGAPVPLPPGEQPTRRERLSRLITEAREGIRAMVHVSPMDAENDFKMFTHSEKLTGTAYSNPNRMLATLFDKYKRCTAGDDRHVNMKDFLDVAIWCLNQLHAPMARPCGGARQARLQGHGH